MDGSLKSKLSLSTGKNEALKEVIAKNLKPAAKRALVAVLQTEHGLSERRACNAVGLQRSVYHYEPRPNADGPIVKLLLELAWQRPEQQTALWLKEYNEERPHKSLGHLTPREYLLTQKPEISSNSWL